MKRSFSFVSERGVSTVAFGTCFIAATYGLVRLAYGLFLPDMQTDLGIESEQAGYISAGSSLVYCGAAAIGFACAATRPRLLVLFATCTACAGVWGMAGAGDTSAFSVFAVISSAGAGFASPALVTIVGRNVVSETGGRAQSTVNAGTGPGLVGAGVLALALLPEWRLAWIAIGVLTAAFAAAVLMADRKRTSSRAAAGVDGLSRSWLVAHLDILVAATLMGAGSSAVWTYGRSFLVETGIGSEHDTIAAWIALGLGATAVIATARTVSTLQAVDAWALSCTAMAVAITALVLQPPHLSIALVACAVFGWGFTAATSSLIAWTADIDPANSAAGTAMLFVALVFGQAIGAAVLGAVITTAGFRPAFTAAAIVTIFAVAVRVACQRRQQSRGRRPSN